MELVCQDCRDLLDQTDHRENKVREVFLEYLALRVTKGLEVCLVQVACQVFRDHQELLVRKVILVSLVLLEVWDLSDLLDQLAMLEPLVFLVLLVCKVLKESRGSEETLDWKDHLGKQDLMAHQVLQVFQD